MNVLRWNRFAAVILVIGLVTSSAVGYPAESVRGIIADPGIEKLKTLEQNWSDDEADWFYNAGQGSRLLPYDWFLALEQPDSTDQELFLAPRHIRALGLIPRRPTDDNPHGLPIGLVRDASYDDGTRGIGITCAACHTAIISHGPVSFVIDGGSTGADIEQFLRSLANSLEKTANDDAVFDRFAKRVTPTASDDDRRTLRDAVRGISKERSAYNERNLSAQGGTPHGPGRIDAFGAIFNEVSATFLEIPGNIRRADAPVSYPCLWDTPQHDRVQWSGIAENRVSHLGTVIFGTRHVGALGRNIGEVTGVFGTVRVSEHELLLPRRYESTVNKPNLLKLEETLSTLWSPEWPEDLPPLDAAKVTRGSEIYTSHCVVCHAAIDRDAADRRVEAVMRAVGTDGRVLENSTRMVSTGRLEHRQRTLQSLGRFQAQAPVAAVLKHVVERAMLEPLPQLKNQLTNAVQDGGLFSPIFHTSIEIRYKGKAVAGDVYGVEVSANGVTLYGSSADLDRVRKALGMEADGARSLYLAQGVVEGAYKARPLNGVWATAPYLHNGSVPTLAALLEPKSRRPAKFHVGSREFDPVRVGFVDDSRFPIFDTSLPGNGREGHEFGTDLPEGEKSDLLEYLKSL